LSYLRLDGLTKNYGNARALDGLSLEVARGACLVLLGPSGCGKTTILNLVAGFLRPDAGRIMLDGQDITALPPHKRDIGMVFQDYALFPHMTLRDNVAFGLRMRGIGRAEQIRQADAALASVGLDTYAARKPGQLSGGQRQRVALARALVIRPRLLLFDEPLSNLDALLRDQLRTEIRAVLDQAGITAIFVTHDQSEALALADRIALLRGGQLEQFGTPTDLYDRPATRFAASFIGGCNLIAQDSVTLAIRPHRMRLDPAGPVQAVLETLEFLGPTTRLTLQSGLDKIVIDLPRPPQGLTRGMILGLGWDAADAWVVPA
jgi:ABC-type Fe3+/spermidine/putrescine transport system ATPase subunit